MENEFVSYEIALALKELGFDQPCFATYRQWDGREPYLHLDTDIEADNFTIECDAPLYQQAINFLYICSNKQIDIELKGSDTYEERIRKIEKGCKDLWNLQNNKSN